MIHLTLTISTDCYDVRPAIRDASSIILTKADNTAYALRVFGFSPNAITCSCPGFARYRHCKHRDAAVELDLFALRRGSDKLQQAALDATTANSTSLWARIPLHKKG